MGCKILFQCTFFSFHFIVVVVLRVVLPFGDFIFHHIEIFFSEREGRERGSNDVKIIFGRCILMLLHFTYAFVELLGSASLMDIMYTAQHTRAGALILWLWWVVGSNPGTVYWMEMTFLCHFHPVYSDLLLKLYYLFERTENNTKRCWVGPFFKKHHSIPNR